MYVWFCVSVGVWENPRDSDIPIFSASFYILLAKCKKSSWFTDELNGMCTWVKLVIYVCVINLAPFGLTNVVHLPVFNTITNMYTTYWKSGQIIRTENMSNNAFWWIVDITKQNSHICVGILYRYTVVLSEVAFCYDTLSKLLAKVKVG